MKLKAIASAFKRSKHLIIHTTPKGEQWVSNGSALYSMDGMPKLTPEQVLQMFDIPEDKRDDWFTDTAPMPDFFSTEDFYDTNTEFKQLQTTVELCGEKLLFFKYFGDIYAFKESYLKPLYDKSEYILYYKAEWTDSNGKKGSALVCNKGLIPKAIICPCMPGNKDVEELKTICNFYNSPAYRLIKDPPKVYPETGEVLDGDSEQYALN